LIKLFQESLGKSAGKLSLYEHLLGSAKVAHFILQNYSPPDYPSIKKSQLLFSTFVHDLGKLDPNFQIMLQEAVSGKPLSGKKIKHEASTLNYAELLSSSYKEIILHLNQLLGCQIEEEIDLELALAFAVTHHGLFYMSFEKTLKYGEKWLIRREWTVTAPSEIKRITLVDLLFLFHPLGGLVMVSDLIHSFCHGRNLDFQAFLKNVTTYRELVEKLLDKSEELQEFVEKGENQGDDALADILLLILGGIS